jgi:hypothetical protein
LHSRLHPCSGWKATIRAASRSMLAIDGHGGLCIHIGQSLTVRQIVVAPTDLLRALVVGDAASDLAVPAVLARRRAIAPTMGGDPGQEPRPTPAGSAGDSRRTSRELTSSYRPSVMWTGDPSAENSVGPRPLGVVVPGRGSATSLILAQTVDSLAGESALVKEAVTPPGSRATDSAYASSAALCSSRVRRNRHGRYRAVGHRRAGKLGTTLWGCNARGSTRLQVLRRGCARTW